MISKIYSLNEASLSAREAIRLWYPKHSLRSWGRLCIKFGAIYTRRLKRKHSGYGDTFRSSMLIPHFFI